MVLGDGTDADVIALAEDQLEAAVQVFYVRGGRVRGQRGWVVDKVEDVTPGDLVEHFLLQLYGEAERRRRCPREVLVPDAAARRRRRSTELLAEQRGGPGRAAGAAARRQEGADGDRRSATPSEALALHKTRRACDLTTRSKALQEIAGRPRPGRGAAAHRVLRRLPPPGHDVVASMVVFEDGLARKSEYRRFADQGHRRQDDVASIHEVITRRFRRYLRARRSASRTSSATRRTTRTARRRRSTRRPAGRASSPTRPTWSSSTAARRRSAAAQRALDELGIDDVAVCGLAKRLEEVWLPGEDDPVILPRTSEGLYLLQRVRDEAHRFAITYHRPSGPRP